MTVQLSEKTYGLLMAARKKLSAVLRDEYSPEGCWRGKLSDSALSTAVTAFALGTVDLSSHKEVISRSLCWLAENINQDGGWGDTASSPSTLSTTMLCWSALGIAEKIGLDLVLVEDKAAAWIAAGTGSLEPARLAECLKNIYGKDQTFSVPILSMCALAGRLGPLPAAWKYVPQLPFELSLLPSWAFSMAGLPVVSYALPALIALGSLRNSMADKVFPFSSFRSLITNKCLGKLEKLQPENGGFLEAAPLTGFVAMSLAAAGKGGHQVVKKCENFLLASLGENGACAIDTGLFTWLTTLIVKAFDDEVFDEDKSCKIKQWLLAQQFRRKHFYTGAAAGGWAWIDKPGGVPDADDTAGALLALEILGVDDTAVISKGVEWLLDIQNSDGGVPTFCRGWGRLAFDRSCPDITAHALNALMVWKDRLPSFSGRIEAFVANGLDYLAQAQDKRGYWLPLWFGDQGRDDHLNPVYGTAKVLADINGLADEKLVAKGVGWLLENQNPDGGWGSVSGVEETSMVLSALSPRIYDGRVVRAVEKAVLWLHKHTFEFNVFPAKPIGLYFASLWYSEKLYPVIFTFEAFNRLIFFHEKK